MLRVGRKHHCPSDIIQHITRVYMKSSPLAKLAASRVVVDYEGRADRLRASANAD